MKKMILLPAAALAAALLSGCPKNGPSTGTHWLEPQDIRLTVEKMVESMQQDVEKDLLEEYGHTNKPVLDFFPVKNSTSQHLNMKSFTDSLRVSLLKTRMFRFVDRSTSANDIAIMGEQARGGLTDPSQVVSAGQQSAAQMTITGEVSEMKSREGLVTDAYYKFSLILKDLRTGEIVWADEQEIRKETVRSRW